jgi:hypothetical protein
MRRAVWLWVLTAIITTAIVLTMPVAEQVLRDSRAPEPTPAPTLEITSTIGKATWYDATKNGAWFIEKPRPGAANRNQEGAPFEFYAAAGPALRRIQDFRWGKKPYRLLVENLRNGRAIVAWVVDWCQCRGQTNNEKLVDLSPAAFVALGVPLGNGVQKVRVTVLP